MAELALKIDIDTYRGFREGLPQLLRILDKRGIHASFFVSFGPDRSGLAVIQLLRPRFLWKMLRTNAPGTYGIETALYGTLLKAPLIGLAFPAAIRQLIDLGHEVACHAWDHRLWQDWLPFMRTQSIHAWFEKMIDAYIQTTGRAPDGFGAPGWRMDKRTLHEVQRWGFQYLSCTRASRPFICDENGMLEIPSNLPCIEEVGMDGIIRALEKNVLSSIPQVLPVHTEVEGNRFRKEFEELLDAIGTLGYSIKQMADLAKAIDRSVLEVRGLREAILPGRAFKCAV